MLTLESLKEEMKVFYQKEAEEMFISEKDTGFSWESYFKTRLHVKCSMLLTEKLLVICQREDKTDNINDGSVISEYIKNLESELISYREVFFNIHNIVPITFESKVNKIVDFFKQERFIDFLSLSEKEKEKTLKYEDIMLSENTIFDFLGITHMQYKYLIQKGQVFLSLDEKNT